MYKENSLKITVFQLQQLVAIDGDTIAFERLYLMFHKSLYDFAFCIIKSHHIAEEIVSDVFVQLWKKRIELGSVLNLKVFLYITVRNQALTYLYKSRNEKVSWIEEFGKDAGSLFTHSDDGDLLINNSFQPASTNLPSKVKAVFTLIKDHQLKYPEASRVLNLSVNTIENLMGIALKKIAVAMKYPNTQSQKIKK